MNKNSKNYRKKELKISGVEITSDRLTGRAGLALFVDYLHQIQIFPLIDRFFGSMRKNKKGVEVFELFKQVLCFMVDGTSRHLTYFDQLAKDAGYAGSIESDMHKMASSHRMKRFFQCLCVDESILVSSAAPNPVHLAPEDQAAQSGRFGYRHHGAGQ